MSPAQKRKPDEKKAKTLSFSLPAEWIPAAQARCEQLGFGTFSEYMRALIKEDISGNSLKETGPPYRHTPSDTDIQAAVEAATLSAVREILGKTPRR